MRERRFYIREFDKDGFIINVRDGAITESELKRRIRRIALDFIDDREGFIMAIQTLLNGEGENGPMDDIAGDWVRPSPTPTRQEWVKWVEKSPWKTDADPFKVFDWLLSMPCVPKE